MYASHTSPYTCSHHQIVPIYTPDSIPSIPPNISEISHQHLPEFQCLNKLYPGESKNIQNVRRVPALNINQ